MRSSSVGRWEGLGVPGAPDYRPAIPAVILTVLPVS
jgi:hypothetical protein